MSCPDDDALLAYAEARAAPAESAAIARHVAACPSCAELLERVERPGPSPGDRIGRYRLLAALGRGGMGAVFEAEDLALGRRVALKVLDPRRGDRLLQETRALARVRHPGVVTIHDVGRTEDGTAFFAMELVQGCSLRDLLAIRPPSPSRALALFIQAGRGLAAAHAAGIAHGDVKPGNLLVTPAGKVEVVDFGLASGTDAADSAGLGTPAYAAPERRAGGPATPASDQYSFCAALREALGSRCSRRLQRALDRGMAQDPGDRFADMTALLAALRPPRRRWRRVAWASVGLGVAGAALAWPADPCATAQDRATQVWSDAARDAVDPQLHGALDAFAEAWVEDARTVCEAQLQLRPLPPHQQRCVDEALADLGALVRAASDPSAHWRSDVGLRWLGEAGDCERARPPSLRPSGPQPRRAALERTLRASTLAPGAVWMLVQRPEGGMDLQLRATPNLALQRSCEVPYDVELWELALHQGRLYTVDRERDRVLSIDPHTCAIEGFASLPRDVQKNGRGFDMAADGTALAILGGDTLHHLDASLSRSQSHRGLGPVGVESLALCPDGTAYLAGQSGHRVGRDLYRLEPGAAPTRVGSIGATKIDIDVLTCTTGGNLLGADTLGPTEGRLQLIDPRSAERTELGVIRGGISGLAAADESTITKTREETLQVG